MIINHLLYNYAKANNCYSINKAFCLFFKFFLAYQNKLNILYEIIQRHHSNYSILFRNIKKYENHVKKKKINKSFLDK